MVIGKPILVGKPDRFVAALYKVQGASNLTTLGGWDYVAGNRATVANNIVTLTNGGTYKLTLWKQELLGSLYSGTCTTTLMHNSQILTSGDTFTANAGDTVRIRVKVSGSDPRYDGSFMLTALLERVET